MSLNLKGPQIRQKPELKAFSETYCLTIQALGFGFRVLGGLGLGFRGIWFRVY